jgi:arylformamidase
MKTYYDVSMTVTKDIQVWKNYEAKKPKFKVVSDFNNSVVHETEVSINLHTGTHMDFPLHMLPDGKTSDSLDLSKLIRTVRVFDLTHVKDAINDADLVPLNIKKNDFVLFKTKNSFEEDFNFNFIYVNEWASQYLAEKGVAGVGVDGLGIERDQVGHPTHKKLMKKDILIIEGLRLKDVPEGTYQMYALPIKMKGTDALLLSVILEVI